MAGMCHKRTEELEMRDIKFRAWDGQNNSMIPHEKLTDLNLAIYANRNLDKYHLMQLTGLKDMNNKEIYEADILKMECIAPEEAYTAQGEVHYCVEAGCYKVRDNFGENDPLEDWDGAEVIGNKYENPELA